MGGVLGDCSFLGGFFGETRPTGLMTFAPGGGGFFSLWVSFKAIGEPAPSSFSFFASDGLRGSFNLTPDS